MSADRIAQGLPAKVGDQTVLDRIAAIVEPVLQSNHEKPDGRRAETSPALEQRAS